MSQTETNMAQGQPQVEFEAPYLEREGRGALLERLNEFYP